MRLLKSKRPRESGIGLPARKKVKVIVDDLQWKEIDVPERLEDAEGFFGLEEIEGVDIRRHENGETVDYLQGRSDAIFQVGVVF